MTIHLFCALSPLWSDLWRGHPSFDPFVHWWPTIRILWWLEAEVSKRPQSGPLSSTRGPNTTEWEVWQLGGRALQQERSAILNPEHQGRGELLENPSTQNTPFSNVAVFFSVFFFFIPICNYVVWSARSLKVNVVLLIGVILLIIAWSPLPFFWLPLCMSRLILASILTIYQHVILKDFSFFFILWINNLGKCEFAVNCRSIIHQQQRLPWRQSGKHPMQQ